MPDPVDTAEFILACRCLEVGDQVYLRTNALDWSNPLTVRSVSATIWETIRETWATAAVTVATDRTEYPIRAVEGLQTPVMERYDYPQHVIEFTVDEGREPVEFTDFSASSGSGAGVMCKNCGSHVRKDFVRVFAPEEADRPRCCPNCEDLVREKDGTIRLKRPNQPGGSGA